jgi:hypothetical protein
MEVLASLVMAACHSVSLLDDEAIGDSSAGTEVRGL